MNDSNSDSCFTVVVAVEPLPGKMNSPLSIGKSLDPVLASLGGPSGRQLNSLFEDWEALVGKSLAQRVRPSGLRHKVLVVSVEDPSWAAQVRWMSAQLVEQITSHVGNGVVEALEVRVERPR